MPELTEWKNFYVILGSSAGTLIGLQFVVITLNLSGRATDANLFYRSANRMMQVSIAAGPAFTASLPRVLFATNSAVRRYPATTFPQTAVVFSWFNRPRPLRPQPKSTSP